VIENDRRFKIAGITPDLIVDILNAFGDMEFICLPVTDSLPEGTKVLAVHDNHERYCLDAILYHESFSPVPLGEAIPRLDGGVIEYRTFVRKPISDGFVEA